MLGIGHNMGSSELNIFTNFPLYLTEYQQSAGAGSCEAHYLYPTDRRLFRAAIAESSTGPL
jgi:hypothetical protein